MQTKIDRCVIVVLDSLGIGALPDASEFGDAGANTFAHIIEGSGAAYSLPNLAALGLYKSAGLDYRVPRYDGSFAKMACASRAKDTTAGHWELSGLILKEAFPTYPNGFPREIIAEFEEKIGTKTLGNKTASGTEIIRELGAEHIKTLFPIVYTSADSVFQVAAHEKYFGLRRLYEVCAAARAILKGKHAVGRVIARPFTGEPGSFERTSNRRDFSLSPFDRTLLDIIHESGGEVLAVGKIEDIFNKRGISAAFHTGNNAEGMKKTLELIKNKASGKSLIFTNLVDFDMLWGHRRDLKSYAAGLKAFDDFLPELKASMNENDVLFITADHGCDPSFTAHTDHTREYAPLLVYGSRIAAGRDLGVRKTFADLAKTIADIFSLDGIKNGESFKKEILNP
ncbi:MAG TPA: phosphopentomutase [Elusimicrobia bacterium]|nr:MAG: phosphopentomutase [Elusimicrobia bacterium RIFOXYA12_FULL_49_49]OGS09480.1 MAG: phosphopentomutase [Elusimicrobia bacterium RIFOXYA1_FULL_47_7]OGS11470.1 MAG: phosphopentomutase [Elusimicrobia bacterium RIFOXYB1_FULL_48_9]OGS15850.1 MAG: phosphopentomutase [Elusimicrobia bacterium RIFOXYA2_FULL_47_53]OGS27144.1 MAG: phosphopentomutase [Elusimicrobia bacterium RIFOXYB12_FULL_50_12]OGS31182.1 MAG: phosphopentomutase [Elusimicrobia bacterium RIFOXYB2_FULL_46_23]HBU70151.1 phosphopentomu